MKWQFVCRVEKTHNKITYLKNYKTQIVDYFGYTKTYRPLNKGRLIKNQDMGLSMVNLKPFINLARKL